jgi:uncharacterized membrane-anchored protein
MIVGSGGVRMETVDVSREHPARKVAEITLGFWLAKVVATTLGEVAGDAIAQTLNLGYVAGLAITLALLAAFLVAQVRADRYHPFLFWATIVGTTTAGTEIADLSTHTLNLGYNATSAILFGGMLLTLGIWYFRRGTCDVSAVVDRENELFFWGAVLFSNSLGTAFGDGLVYVFGLTYTTGSLVCMAMIGVVLLLHYVARVNAAFIFWAAFVFTRPFGADFGNLLTKEAVKGGFGLNTFATALICVLLLTGVVVFFERRQHLVNRRSRTAA